MFERPLTSFLSTRPLLSASHARNKSRSLPADAAIILLIWLLTSSPDRALSCAVTGTRGDCGECSDGLGARIVSSAIDR